jgi:hypothetical protein
MSRISPINRRRRRGRRIDETGHSIGETRHVRLYHWVLNTQAWRSLPPACRALCVEIAQRFNGSNNGKLSMSVREAARLLYIAKDTATKCFHELEAIGFIKQNICGSFNWKRKHATTWILTEHTFGDQVATKEFASWVPKKSEVGPKRGRRCPKRGTDPPRFRSIHHLSVPALGPWALSCTVPRSQSPARI